MGGYPLLAVNQNLLALSNTSLLQLYRRVLPSRGYSLRDSPSTSYPSNLLPWMSPTQTDVEFPGWQFHRNSPTPSACRSDVGLRNNIGSSPLSPEFNIYLMIVTTIRPTGLGVLQPTMRSFPLALSFFCTPPKSVQVDHSRSIPMTPAEWHSLSRRTFRLYLPCFPISITPDKIWPAFTLIRLNYLIKNVANCIFKTTGNLFRLFFLQFQRIYTKLCRNILNSFGGSLGKRQVSLTKNVKINGFK